MFQKKTRKICQHDKKYAKICNYLPMKDKPWQSHFFYSKIFHNLKMRKSTKKIERCQAGNQRETKKGANTPFLAKQVSQVMIKRSPTTQVPAAARHAPLIPANFLGRSLFFVQHLLLQIPLPATGPSMIRDKFRYKRTNQDL